MNNKLRFLNYDEVTRMLERHALYNKSNGKEGKQADLSACRIEDFDFSKHDLEDVAHARESIFIRCNFSGCDLYSINFNDSELIEANFRAANLGKADFSYANASNACFDEANLGSAEFARTYLHGATFRNANLGGASFVECDLTNAVFDGADLENASINDNIENGTSWAEVKNHFAFA